MTECTIEELRQLEVIKDNPKRNALSRCYHSIWAELCGIVPGDEFGGYKLCLRLTDPGLPLCHRTCGAAWCTSAPREEREGETR